MGGGDLNSKKSWHPNTMKNQERVWKAEQAAMQEKKRIVELQRERAEERDRAELNDLVTKHSTASTANENRLAWMYDKPDKKVEQEEYLLGKAINKNSEPDKAEQDAIPAVARRVVGSSMLATAGDSQVDLARKVREDPLLLIKERERAARAALLNNPLQRRRLTELLRKEQDQRKESKNKKKPKKKHKDLDDMLAAKLTALGAQKGINLATLLDSNDSSSSSSEEEKPVKRKEKRKQKKEKKKSKKSKKQSSDSDSDSSMNEKKHTHKEDKKSKHKSSQHKTGSGHRSETSKRQSDEKLDADNEIKNKRPRKDVSERHDSEHDRRRFYDQKNESGGSYRRSSPRDTHKSSKDIEQRESNRRGGLSSEEKAAKLAAMAAAGAERELQRGRRVAQQRAADAADAAAQRQPRSGRNEARCLPDSLQSRIHSNRHYIQRDQRHMNEHFARR